MIENAKRMWCGGCGHKEFAIYRTEDELVVECLGCKSQSNIGVSTPKLVIEWGEYGDGRLTT